MRPIMKRQCSWCVIEVVKKVSAVGAPQPEPTVEC